MCGVFGYTGSIKTDLSGFILQGLTKLEYRGYDSAGIAVFQNGSPKIVKEAGELDNLKKKLSNQKLFGSIAIGHTRWATHGGVTKANAHPHKDCTGNIVVVHNGIIENFEKLKSELIKKGHTFRSQTDTEVFAHLVEERLKTGSSFKNAVRISFNRLKGLNAVVCVSEDGGIVAFRKGSPLVAGIGKKGNFISSDIPALSSLTQRIILIEEEEGVIISKDSIVLVNSKNGSLKKPKVSKIKMQEGKISKAGFKHFLIKEINDQPEVIARVANSNRIEIKQAKNMIKSAKGVFFTACGTASYAGLAATYMFSQIAGEHVNFAVGSEFPYFEDFLVAKSLLIAASQSGETMDTLEAVRAAKRHHSKVLALVNVPGSSLSRLANKTIMLKAGPERAVLSTKAYIAKLSYFLLFAYSLADKYNSGVKLLNKTSKQMSQMLKGDLESNVKKLARKLKNKQSIYIIGRGVNYPTALEGALKIKEASYIHAEGFAGGELKHGVIALIEKGTPCIAIVANDEAKESTLSNAQELAARGAYIIGISPTKESVFDYHLKVPDAADASPIISVVPIQLLAYHLTLLKGYNPDKPRNLAKSVTVK